MHFIADKQTLDDLNILGKYKGNSIFNLFDHTHTRGGSQVLERMFQQPMREADAINVRSSLFQYFQSKALQFPVSRELCEETEHYLSASAGNGLAGTAFMILQKKVLRIIGSDPAYELMQTGMLSLRKLLQVLKDWYAQIDEGTKVTPYQQTIRSIQNLFQHSGLQAFLAELGSGLSVGKMIRYDHLLRHRLYNELTQLMQRLYELDVYITVSRVATERNFHYAHAIPWAEQDNRIVIEQVTHPQLLGAVANNMSLRRESNMIFLTGANMAGKSTFMKSVGIAIYLAHMGFPVAAAGMEFSVQDGLYTSINVADNLQQGYSHFYAEVLRVKQVAEEVSRSKNLVIIFDELFKGTNVKDAYDATVAVTDAFGENSNVHFIVSTHIVEAGEVLQERCSNMQFVYFPTLMDTGIPRYPYTLQSGISGDRHGMMIIQNERIIEIIRGIA